MGIRTTIRRLHHYSDLLEVNAKKKYNDALIEMKQERFYFLTRQNS